MLVRTSASTSSTASPPVRRPDLLFFGLVVVENAVFYSTFFRSCRKWQLFLVSCVFSVAFRTLFINLAPRNAGIYSTCPSEFLDFLLLLKSRFSCPKPSDQNEGFLAEF